MIVSVAKLHRMPARAYKRRASVVTHAYSSIGDVLVSQSELIGRSLTLFVFFTASLNYLHYRDIRKRIEEYEKENLKKENKTKDKHDL